MFPKQGLEGNFRFSLKFPALLELRGQEKGRKLPSYSLSQEGKSYSSASCFIQTDWLALVSKL